MPSNPMEDRLVGHAVRAEARDAAEAEEAKADARFAAWQSRQCHYNMATGEITQGIWNFAVAADGWDY